ncbi:MAG: RNA pseudouridine synthase, partial [Bacteroidaceae bacterium]|nr:RNA pseudouridine synthase [Bacteroidaceae bacterium]
MSITWLHTFEQDVELLGIPQQFTFPFYYQPHPLCKAAAEQVKEYLKTFIPWQQEQGGKMFGVLVVRDDQGSLGFLAAYSGNLAGRNDFPYFVPPVFDLLNPTGHFIQEEAEISSINREIGSIREDSEKAYALKAERKARSQA